MTGPPPVPFDADGTLVDSNGHVVAGFSAMCEAGGQPARDGSERLSVVGLSLDACRGAFVPIEAGDLASPSCPGSREALESVAAPPRRSLGTATGKSRRGLRHVFATAQTADGHLSKPPSPMIAATLVETGAETVGDTVIDIGMGRAAVVATVGVAREHHPSGFVAEAVPDVVITDFGALGTAIREVSEVLA